jgi:hypothetical protein
MDNSPPPSQSIIPNIEDTFLGVPSFKDLTKKNSEWLDNLQRREYVTNNRLTKDGKVLFRKEVRTDWVRRNSDGIITAHPDFGRARYVVDNESIDHADQLKINLLNRDICLLSAFTENLKLYCERIPDQERLTEFENAQKDCKEAFETLNKLLYEKERLMRNPTWEGDYKSYTLNLAKTTDRLYNLVTEADRNTRLADGEDLGQSSTLPADDSGTTFSTQPQATGTTSVSGPSESSEHRSDAAGAYHYEDDSPSGENPQSAARTPSAGVFGGFYVPLGTGDFVSSANYVEDNEGEDEDEAETGRNSEGKSRFIRFKAALSRRRKKR